MARKQTDNTEFNALVEALKSGSPANLYIFYGEERYLLEHYLEQLRSAILTDGFEEFNYRRFDGKSLTIDELSYAVDSLPVFAERTFIEVHDFDIFKCTEEDKNTLISIFSDIPDYVCLVLVYNTIEYKPDGRIKLNAELKKLFSIVEFRIQEQSRIIKWIKVHFQRLGKEINDKDAEYLTFVTGGLMTTLSGEIEKVAAYSRGNDITRADIDAVVTPVLDAVIYKLTDSITARDFDQSAKILDDLFRMREVPHKIIYSISLKLRQLLAAKLCLADKLGVKDLMRIANIKYEFQARNLLGSARGVSLEWCRNALRRCSDTALQLNSSRASGEELLTELIVSIASDLEAK